MKKEMVNQEKEMSMADVPSATENVSFQETGKKPSKLFYVGAIILLVGVILYFGSKKYGNLIVVATVDGKPITRITLWQKLDKRFGSQMLDEMVNEQIIRNEMQKKNIVISQADIDKKIKDLEIQFKNQAGLDQMLALQGMTRDDLRSQIELQLAIEKIVPTQKVTDQEIQSYYDQNQPQYGEELTESVKQQIKNTLLQQKTSKVFSDWFDKVKKQVRVVKY